MINEDIDNKIQEGLDYLNNNPEKALDTFNEVLELSCNNVSALNGKGSALIKLNNYDEAEKIFLRSIEIKKTSSAFLNMGIIYKSREDYHKALSYYDQALEINNNLGNIINLLKNEVEECLNIQERHNILDEYGEEVRNLIEEGYKYKKSERFWDALDCYELAIQKNPSCRKVVSEYIEEIKIILLKEFLFKQPKIDDAIIELLKVQSINDLFFDDNQTSALVNIEKVLEINPNDVEALNIKGCILFYFDDFEESIRCFDKCIHIDSYYVYAFFNKSLVLRRMKRLSESFKCFEQIMKINHFPTNVEIYQEEILEKLSVILDMPIN
ncbi:MAG: tetratricopeptide repeat protein [Methanosphaera sp.]|nr:tetratricopeptide repeat protein [Methanosphaera sp.]